MKGYYTFLDKRIQKDLNIPEEMYIDGLLDVTQLLCFELERLLEEENRYFGIALSYMNSIKEAFQKISSDTVDDNYEVYGKILFLYKPLIMKEYRKLEKRKLSKADCIITICKRLLDLILEYKNNNHQKETRTINKVITKFFDNIHNYKKNTGLTLLCDSIRKYMDLGLVGRYSLDHFSIEEEEDRFKKTILEGDGIRLEETNNKVAEVEWAIDL